MATFGHSFIVPYNLQIKFETNDDNLYLECVPPSWPCVPVHWQMVFSGSWAAWLLGWTDLASQSFEMVGRSVNSYYLAAHRTPKSSFIFGQVFARWRRRLLGLEQENKEVKKNKHTFTSLFWCPMDRRTCVLQQQQQQMMFYANRIVDYKCIHHSNSVCSCLVHKFQCPSGPYDHLNGEHKQADQCQERDPSQYGRRGVGHPVQAKIMSVSTYNLAIRIWSIGETHHWTRIRCLIWLTSLRLLKTKLYNQIFLLFYYYVDKLTKLQNHFTGTYLCSDKNWSMLQQLLGIVLPLPTPFWCSQQK